MFCGFLIEFHFSQRLTLYKFDDDGDDDDDDDYIIIIIIIISVTYINCKHGGVYCSGAPRRKVSLEPESSKTDSASSTEQTSNAGGTTIDVRILRCCWVTPFLVETKF